MTMIPAIQFFLIDLIFKPKMMFLLRRTLRFDESYCDPEDTSSLLFDDKNGA